MTNTNILTGLLKQKKVLQIDVVEDVAVWKQ